MLVLKSGKRAQFSLDKALLKSEKRQRECSSSSETATGMFIVVRLGIPASGNPGLNPQPINPTLRLSPLLGRVQAMVLGCRPSQGSPSQRTSQPGSSVFVDTFIQSESGGKGGGGRAQETFAKKGSQHRATSSLS